MLIDWFTVGAQLLNFLVLVWLLKRFLYKPILAAIDARENIIAAKLADASAKQAEAEKLGIELESKNKAFDSERGALLNQATVDANTAHDALLANAHKEVDALHLQSEAALQSDSTRLSSEITRLAQTEVFEIARKTLTDLASSSLEERISDAFTRRLRTLNGAAKDTLATALKAATGPTQIRSAFALPATQKEAIQTAVNESFSADIPLDFETAPEAICGIELTASGQKLSWSIADYLNGLEQKVAALTNVPAEAA